MGSLMSSSAGGRDSDAPTRAMTSASSKMDKILEELDDYRGIENSKEYQKMKDRIVHIQTKLQKKVAEPQPELKTQYDTTMQKISKALETLEEKTASNTEDSRRPPLRMNGNMTPPSPNTRRAREEYLTQEAAKKAALEAEEDEVDQNDELLMDGIGMVPPSPNTRRAREEFLTQEAAKKAALAAEAEEGLAGNNEGLFMNGVGMIPPSPKTRRAREEFLTQEAAKKAALAAEPDEGLADNNEELPMDGLGMVPPSPNTRRAREEFSTQEAAKEAADTEVEQDSNK